jgi:hypothetical protein
LVDGSDRDQVSANVDRCFADADGNGCIDQDDRAAIDYFLTHPGSPSLPTYDVNCDGVIDSNDLSFVSHAINNGAQCPGCDH